MKSFFFFDLKTKNQHLFEIFPAQIKLNGFATYMGSSMGSESSPAIDRFGPELKTEDPSASKKLDGSTTSTSDDGSTNAPIMSSRFDFLPANTNFTVSICAVTRSQEVKNISMPLKNRTDSCQIMPAFVM